MKGVATGSAWPFVLWAYELRTGERLTLQQGREAEKRAMMKLRRAVAPELVKVRARDRRRQEARA